MTHLLSDHLPATLSDRAVASMHAMATGTLADLERLTHPEAVNREAVDEPPAASEPGAAGFWATAQWLRTAFSDLDFQIHEVVEDGDLVVVHNTMSGRQTGTFVIYGADARVEQAMPATGKAFATTQTHWLRVRDGMVIEHWANRDDQGMAMQVGWVPPTPWFLLKALVATRRARRGEAARRTYA